MLALITLIPGQDSKYLWSMATGYVSIIFLAATLIIGPLNVYAKKNNPISSDVRRDIGIWCGMTGVGHVIIGSQVHMGNVWLYFFKAAGGEGRFQGRADIFGFANYSGLVAGIILLVLFLISNDLSLRLFKAKRWKNIQRLNYLLFALVLADGILYQVIEKRAFLIVTFFALIMFFPIIAQVIGFRLKRTERS